jgi:hypothetical protein
LGLLSTDDEKGRTLSWKEEARGGMSAKKAGRQFKGSMRIPAHFVKDFAEIYETIVFLA